MHAVDEPEPGNGGGDIDPAISGVNPTGSSGMQGEQPNKQRERSGGGKQHSYRSTTLHPEQRQIAAYDLGNCRRDK